MAGAAHARAPDWPAPAADVARAIAILAGLRRGARVTIATDRDVDGLSGGAIVRAALERRGVSAEIVVAHRGEHVHTDAMRARLRATRPDASPDALVVVDMGSRAGAILDRVPTIVIDHHRPTGCPEGAILVSAHDHPPIASSSWLALHVAGGLADVSDLEWLAVLGAYADLGAKADLPGFAAALGRAGRKDVAEAVALLNAARRAPVPIEDVAARALIEARSAADVARGRVAGVDRLAEARRAVAEETARCARVAPKVAGRFALLRFSSPAQVHPLVATRWTGRLRGKIVIAANDGYLPGRVSFVVRCSEDVDLIEVLRAHAPNDAGAEYANGHARATGGSLTPRAFEELLANLGLA